MVPCPILADGAQGWARDRHFHQQQAVFDDDRISRVSRGIYREHHPAQEPGAQKLLVWPAPTPLTRPTAVSSWSAPEAAFQLASTENQPLALLMDLDHSSGSATTWATLKRRPC